MIVMMMMRTERYDDKNDEDKTDSPLQSNRLDPQRAHCYRAEAGCSASLPDEDGGGGGADTDISDHHNKPPQLITR